MKKLFVVALLGVLVTAVTGYAVEEGTWGKLKSLFNSTSPAAKATVTTVDVDLTFLGPLVICGDVFTYPTQDGNLHMRYQAVIVSDGTRSHEKWTFRESSFAVSQNTGRIYEITGRQSSHTNATLNFDNPANPYYPYEYGNGVDTFNLWAIPLDGSGPKIHLTGHFRTIIPPGGDIKIDGSIIQENCGGK
jgi:hypothetical protein